ncbi:MAG: GNAT family N-acetyltransferase [Acidimicrobiia bacterium]|nr:GNAT family N-acetyltransferase [Acidimicrobiia bacterium]
MEIYEAGACDGEVVAAVQGLVPQLSTSASVPSPEQVAELCEAEATVLLLARLDGAIVGMLVLALFRLPTGMRAWIEDVVVEDAVRGAGVGEALTREALERATSAGAVTVDLTSRPSREAAIRLYERMGFERRETGVYRWRDGSG